MMTKPIPDVDIASFHEARSRLLDSYVRIEEAVGFLLFKAKIPINGEFLGQRIELLKKAKPGPQYSKERRASVLLLIAEFEPFQAIRADVAHGRLQVVTIDNEPCACFINSRYCAASTRTGRLISMQQFVKLNTQLKSIADRFAVKDVAPNPPSSPPPPLPGAAGVP